MNEVKDDIFNMQTFDPQGVGNGTIGEGADAQTKSLQDMKAMKRKMRQEKKKRKKQQEQKELIAKAILIAILISSVIIAIDILRTYS